MRRGLTIAGPILLTALAVAFVGPWPTYGRVDLARADYYREAIAELDRSAARSVLSTRPGALRAGWARRPIELLAGLPLAGYSRRDGRPNSGVHDPLFVKAVVLSDGADTVVIVGCGLLIVPENLAAAVRREVLRSLDLPGDRILFNATHTHSGPGGWAPGWVGAQFAGKHDPDWADSLTETFVAAIEAAHRNLLPARIAHGTTPVPGLIANRVRAGAAVDPDLQWLLIETQGGERCCLVSYAAHPTILGPDNMLLSGDYPGFLERGLEGGSIDFALFLAGAVGSMKPVHPQQGDSFDSARFVGEALAAKVLAQLQPPQPGFESHPDLATAGAPIQMPELQVRINRSWRWSPRLPRLLGVNNQAWLQAVRLGDVILVGFPADFSGEISPGLKRWAERLGIQLWTLSFNGDYIGYVSPDRYYDAANRGRRERYELLTMSWCGPQQEQYLTALAKRAVSRLTDRPQGQTRER